MNWRRTPASGPRAAKGPSIVAKPRACGDPPSRKQAPSPDRRACAWRKRNEFYPDSRQLLNRFGWRGSLGASAPAATPTSGWRHVTTIPCQFDPVVKTETASVRRTPVITVLRVRGLVRVKTGLSCGRLRDPWQDPAEKPSRQRTRVALVHHGLRALAMHVHPTPGDGSECAGEEPWSQADPLAQTSSHTSLLSGRIPLRFWGCLDKRFCGSQ